MYIYIYIGTNSKYYTYKQNWTGSRCSRVGRKERHESIKKGICQRSLIKIVCELGRGMRIYGAGVVLWSVPSFGNTIPCFGKRVATLQVNAEC